jgi:hypothetical protein
MLTYLYRMDDENNDPESENIASWLASSLAPHKRKRATEKRKLLRGTSYSSSTNSEPSEGKEKPYKYRSEKRNLGARFRKQRRVSLSRIQQAQDNHSFLSNHCLALLLPAITLIAVIGYNSDYITLSPAARKRMLMAACKARGPGRCQFGITIDTIQLNVCNACFAAFHGIGLRTLQRMIASINSGVIRLNAVKPKERTGSTTMLKQEAAAWVEQTYLHFGDYMPDESTICLPVYTRTEFFDWYSCADRNIKVYSKCAFFNLLREEYSFLCFRRFKKFMQCGFCHDIDWLVSVEKVSIL